MEEVILAEEILEKIEGIIHQIDDTVSGTFTMTEELLHQVKEELEDIVNV